MHPSPERITAHPLELADAHARLASPRWLSAKSENFRHLPPPPLASWLSGPSEPIDPTLGWRVLASNPSQSDQFITQYLNPAVAAQRSLLLRGVPLPDESDAAHFGWVHRATCQRGLRLHIAGDPSRQTTSPLHLLLHVAPPALFDAPLLVLDVAPGAHCVLLEHHAFEADRLGGVQNLQMHIRLGHGARLQHVRIVNPAGADRLAHQLHVTQAPDSHYAQTLLASGSAYHLQRTQINLRQPRSVARIGAALWVANSALDHQVALTHTGCNTHSAVESLLLASGKAQAVLNAHTLIAPGADAAQVHQRLSAIPTSGQPRVVLRPHMEIHHDQVQARHGATYGALPDETLFYARSRGLDEASALALILQGLQRAVLERSLDEPELLTGLQLDVVLARMTQQHLQGRTP